MGLAAVLGLGRQHQGESLLRDCSRRGGLARFGIMDAPILCAALPERHRAGHAAPRECGPWPAHTLNSPESWACASRATVLGSRRSSQVAVEQAGGTECCSLRAVGARDYLPDRGGAYRRFRG